MLNSQQSTILKDIWGFDRLRPNQEPIIEHVLKNKSALVLLPTGGGKSLCYQLPAMLQEGLTVVVSPLIALMKDQVDDLRTHGVAAAFLNSSISAEETRTVARQINENELKLLYVSPERIAANDFQLLQWLEDKHVNRIAIDEAHCISAWGHNFRPEYTQLNRLREFLPNVPILALTATADEATKEDIMNQLNLAGERVFLNSFDRPNIHYSVRPRKNEKEQLLSYVQTQGNSTGIVYCLSRKKTEEIAQHLEENGFRATYYHAGLTAQEREERQGAFKHDDIQIIVATIAFGMGIDKPNVRFVVHLNLPKNMESYYQETGRAGRDGEESEAVLFYKSADFSLLAGFFDDETEDQKNLLLNKLRRMGDFADAYTCRRKILLQYFNETRASNACGKCDNCDTPQRTWDGTETAQKLFSTLARLQYDYGLAHSVSILRGSKAKKITPAQQQLSTYGIGKEHSQSAWMDIGKQLIQLGFIEQSIGQYPVVRLNHRSWQVLRGHERVELVQFEARPDAPADASSRSRSTRGRQASSESAEVSAAIKGSLLFEKLRTKRLEIAQNLGVPAFVIVSDKTLVALCEGLPTDPSSLLQVHGFGKVKAKRFGNDFLDVIHSHSVASEA